ncbi:type II toxin-antitoxin system RelE/ParE family toxin [Methylosinus sp. Sm6]|uniref:type II toxin-antitoxin system RelE/ParE family toxin n=1 Tax=Methylosinus sp. Sm6 TaxID=2866948 RepID=UPI00351D3DCB
MERSRNSPTWRRSSRIWTSWPIASFPARGRIDAAWRIRLGEEAEKDFIHILQSTKDKFGERQVGLYRQTLRGALATLEAGPDVLGSIARDEILPKLGTLHVARRGRRGRHLVIYRAAPGHVIEILRILHDAMDLARHLPPELVPDL